MSGAHKNMVIKIFIALGITEQYMEHPTASSLVLFIRSWYRPVAAPRCVGGRAVCSGLLIKNAPLGSALPVCQSEHSHDMQMRHTGATTDVNTHTHAAGEGVFWSSRAITDILKSYEYKKEREAEEEDERAERESSEEERPRGDFKKENSLSLWTFPLWFIEMHNTIWKINSHD